MGFKRKAAKRKAKSDPAEEIEDVEEPDVKDPWCTPDPKWGEDSFEGHDYRSSEEEDLFEDDPESENYGAAINASSSSPRLNFEFFFFFFF